MTFCLFVTGCLDADFRLEQSIKEAVTEAQEGNTAAAINKLESLHDKYPNDANVVEALAIAYNEHGNYLLASNYYQKAARLSPDKLALLKLSAKGQVKAGRMEDAAARLELFLETFPEDGDAWLDLGRIQYELNQPEVATDSLTRGILLTDASKHSADDLLKLGGMYLELKDFAQADFYLNSALGLVDDATVEGLVLAALVKSSVAQEDWDTAEVFLSRISANQPELLNVVEIKKLHDTVKNVLNLRDEDSGDPVVVSVSETETTDVTDAAEVGLNAAENAAATVAVEMNEEPADAGPEGVGDDTKTIDAEGEVATETQMTEVVPESTGQGESNELVPDGEGEPSVVDSGSSAVEGELDTALAQVGGVAVTAGGVAATVEGETSSASIDVVEQAGDSDTVSLMEEPGIEEDALQEDAAFDADEPDDGAEIEGNLPEETMQDAADQVEASEVSELSGPEHSDSDEIEAEETLVEEVPQVEEVPEPLGTYVAPENEAELLLIQAQQAIADGNVSSAIRMSWDSINQRPENPAGWFILSRAYVEFGQDLNAESAALEAVRLNPKNKKIVMNYLGILQRSRKNMRFHEELLKAYQRFPKDPDFVLALARSYARIQNDPGNAAALYRRFFDLAPEHEKAAEIRQEASFVD